MHERSVYVGVIAYYFSLKILTRTLSQILIMKYRDKNGGIICTDRSVEFLSIVRIFLAQ